MVEIADARGCHISHFKKAIRIVSLVPSQTELLFDLGLESEVIGITKFCIHPEVWFRTKTRIGGTKNIDVEKIKALQPDLILANKEENEKEQIEELAAQFPVWVTNVSNLNDAFNMIETVGFLTGKKEAATFLNTHIAKGFEKLNAVKPLTPIRVCYLIWKEPYLTVGGDTFIHDMLEQVGFKNVFRHETRYPEISLHALQKINPHVLLLSSEPYPFSEKHISIFQSHLPDTKICLADGEMFSWYGSRLQQAPSYFESLLTQLNRI